MWFWSRIWSFFDNRKGGQKKKIHGSMQNYWRSCPRQAHGIRHSSTLVPEIELFGEIGRMTGNRWSNSAMLDFWFIVDRFYFCHIENSRNPTLPFNLFSVSYFLYDWMLPVQRQRNLFQCDWSIFLLYSITFHKDFVKLKTKKIVCEIFDAILMKFLHHVSMMDTFQLFPK